MRFSFMLDLFPYVRTNTKYMISSSLAPHHRFCECWYTYFNVYSVIMVNTWYICRLGKPLSLFYCNFLLTKSANIFFNSTLGSRNIYENWVVLTLLMPEKRVWTLKIISGSFFIFFQITSNRERAKKPL